MIVTLTNMCFIDLIASGEDECFKV